MILTRNEIEDVEYVNALNIASAAGCLTEEGKDFLAVVDTALALYDVAEKAKEWCASKNIKELTDAATALKAALAKLEAK